MPASLTQQLVASQQERKSSWKDGSTCMCTKCVLCCVVWCVVRQVAWRCVVRCLVWRTSFGAVFPPAVAQGHIPPRRATSHDAWPHHSATQKFAAFHHLPLPSPPSSSSPSPLSSSQNCYSLLPASRGHFMERTRRPRKRSDPEGRGVWDFTCNHEAAGSDVWLKPGFSSSSAQPSRP